MVDTREVFAGYLAGGGTSQPGWKKRLDELLPVVSSSTSHTHHRCGYQDDDTSPPAPPAPPSSQQHGGGGGGGGESATGAAASARGGEGESIFESASSGAVGQYYDDGADLQDELWVTRKYLSHQGTGAIQQLEQHQQKAKALRQQHKKKTKKNAATAGGSDGVDGGGGTRRPDDWTSDRTDPLTRPRQSDATLSCPCCFTPLCYDCQRHDAYVNQYRAMFVTEECAVRKADLRVYGGDRYHAVFCSVCDTEVGVYEPSDEIYHFYHTIPGN